MKIYRFVFLFLLLINYYGYSQTPVLDIFPIKDGLVNYNGVVEVDSSIKAIDLYVASKSWALDAFKSSKDVIQQDDKDLQILYIKAFTPITDLKRLWFTLKIETKDGRYRYSLYDIIYEGEATVMGQTAHVTNPFEENISKANSKEKTIEFYRGFDAKFRNIISSLEVSMKKAKRDDW